MKKRYNILLLITIAILSGCVATAQDIHFSQFYETPLYRNPALAGIVNGDVRVQSTFRTQWNSVSHAYKTGAMNAEYKNHVDNADDYLTLGMQVFYDKAGTAELTTSHVMPVLNYHKSISSERNVYLSLGFMGGLVQRHFDRSKITTNSQYDGMGDGESLSQSQYSYFDGSVGMTLNANFGDNPENNLVVGAAYHHVNKPKISFYANDKTQLQPKYVFSGGLKFGVDETAYITIEADHFKQGTYQETMAGMMYGMKIGTDTERPDYVLHGGAFIRWNDAFVPAIKLDYHPFSFGLSYDANISKLKPSSYGRGGFELTLSYVGFLDRENSTLNSAKCPRF
jgi:type IX secretion system PorP/SprF family membrane protein